MYVYNAHTPRAWQLDARHSSATSAVSPDNAWPPQCVEGRHTVSSTLRLHANMSQILLRVPWTISDFFTTVNMNLFWIVVPEPKQRVPADREERIVVGERGTVAMHPNWDGLSP